MEKKTFMPQSPRIILFLQENLTEMIPYPLKKKKQTGTTPHVTVASPIGTVQIWWYM